MKKAQLNMAELIAPMISSRDVVDILKKAIKKTKSRSVDFDFSEVRFVSRSAAHALLMLKEELNSQEIEINFINTQNAVKDMIRIVAANRAVPKKEKVKFNPKIISINSLLNEGTR
ncbi:MAG: STAS domain-containing protein [Candidatus Paceibacterota bacterium]|jgi:anti-anti-sigma regulatory factor